MIEASVEQLPRESVKALRLWLNRPERKILELVISSRGKKAEAEAVKRAIEASLRSASLEQVSLLSDEAINEAARFASFQQILDALLTELLDENLPLEITKIR